MSDGWITEEMHGTIYYYYDKVLVADCKLRTLEPYVGKIAKGSTVQLLVNIVEKENVYMSASAEISRVGDFHMSVPAEITRNGGFHMSASAEISRAGDFHMPAPAEIFRAGDFYLAAPSENIIYQIHRNGTLIRAYAAAVSQVEETIMDVPMSILAILQGKILLHGTVISVWDDTYVVFGDAEVLKCSGLTDTDTILIEEGMEGYRGILSYRFGNNAELYGQQPIPKLKGILVLQHIAHNTGVTLITEIGRKEQLLLEHVVGFSMFSQELQEDISNITFLKEAGQKLPMAVLCVAESGKFLDDIDSYDFSILY